MARRELGADSAAFDGLDGLDGLDAVVRPRWREPKVRRALLGLVFVVGVFVVAPVVAMLVAAN